jgi:hypothetical protein
VPGGGVVALDLKVMTARWFGVDRIEIYRNGQLVKVLNPKSKPSDIVDFDGKVAIDVPPQDSWVVVVAMGLEDQNLMSPVALDVAFGEIQLSKVTSDAFALIPVVNTFFAPIPILPDWYPIPAYAVTNAIYLDTNNNGDYDPPLPLPDFCSKPCDPLSTEVQCPDGQQCLTTPDAMNTCGVFIPGTCDHRFPWAEGGGGSSASDAGAP